MPHPLLSSPPGTTLFLLGNEAITRGALEAGVNFISCYPGTPSSEVPDTFYRLSGEPEAGFYFEYSTNEKVAMEVAGGASIGGAMTLVTMKHVGVNVAADPLLTLTYIGTPGGLLLLSADDPGCHSSQNEQDNRAYARMASLPCFEPATADEAREMTRQALLLSRRLAQPVMLRTTTRVNHIRGPVVLRELPAPARIKPFISDPSRFVPVPAHARGRHKVMLENMEQAAREAENSSFNTVRGQGRTGVIASGVSRAYLSDALKARGWEDRLRIFELGFSYPLPEKRLLDFLRQLDHLLVLEELEPLLEAELRVLVERHALKVKISGKGGNLTRLGEYSVSAVEEALARLLGETFAGAPVAPARELPGRPPNLCPGCSHRSVYYAVRQVFGDEAVYSSDIGCYTLGLLPPHRAADFLFCMGSSVSGGSGLAKATGKPVVAFIGDSTFFHSGMTGLVNAVFNRHNILLVILDNKTTAMTGHQPHPGVDQSCLGDLCQVDMEAAVRGCGVTQVSRVKGYNVKALISALTEMKGQSGVRVLIAEEPCVLFAKRSLGRKVNNVARMENQGEDLERCVATLACPAFSVGEKGMLVDESRCAGCMVCLQISPAMKAAKKDS